MKREQIFYNASEFAKIIGVDKATVFRWLKLGYIPDAELKVFGNFKVWQIPEDAVKNAFPVRGSAYLLRERPIAAD